MDQPPPPKKSANALQGLSPLGLMDGVMGGQSTDWEPPLAEDLEQLFPGYHDFKFIDRGGMGAVYSAVQKSLERRVAIKILPPEISLDEAFVDRFHQEARLLARLQHPHIVAVYDFGRNESGHLFIVMEYVEGTSLLDVMKKERLPLSRALEVTVQVCEALQFAHDRGVIHRDIKPTNILLDVWGRVRVADFGLAKLAESSHQTTKQVRSAMLMGTPGYTAPEQRHGDKDMNHRADIFSLGVTLYEMLTGHLPVGVFEPPSKKVQSPAGLDKIINRCLRERPADRYQQAKELRAAILQQMEKMERSVMQRAIAKRPIVSMMTSVIVGAGFIYLLDALDREVLRKQAAAAPVPTYVDSEHGPIVLKLNETFSLVRLRLTWDEARRRIDATEGIQLASIRSEEELNQLRALLKEQNITSHIWLGGRELADQKGFRWEDGSPFTFAAWMPASPEPPLMISEIQAKNQRTLREPSGRSPDWIEVYNPGPTPVDLTGWNLRQISGRYAMDGRLGRQEGSAKAALVVPPGGYQIIHCEEADGPMGDDLAFSFQLEAQSARLRWSDPRGRLIQDTGKDWKSFPADASLIFDADTHSWSWSQEPTPGQPNSQAREFFSSSADSQAFSQAIIMLPSFDCRWSLDTQRRTAWSLVRHSKRDSGL